MFRSGCIGKGRTPRGSGGGRDRVERHACCVARGEHTTAGTRAAVDAVRFGKIQTSVGPGCGRPRVCVAGMSGKIWSQCTVHEALDLLDLRCYDYTSSWLRYGPNAVDAVWHFGQPTIKLM